jgi:hypothetical protein
MLFWKRINWYKRIKSVNYQWALADEVLVNDFNDGGFFYISEPGQGLWALRSWFSG